jgi:hypothetical protein
VPTEIEILKVKFDVLLWYAHNHRSIAEHASKLDGDAGNSVDPVWPPPVVATKLYRQR